MYKLRACSNNETDLQALLAFKRTIYYDPQGALSSWNETNLSRCTNLYYLNLIDNNLTGVIFPELGSLLKLEALGLTRNHLSGTIPPFIGNFTNLVKLSLGYCFFYGEIPESLVRLQTLQLLNLVGNNLSGRIPPGLYNISTISIFSMRSNQLQGTIPSEIGVTFPRLRIFDMGENQLHGTIPVSLSNSSLLEIINLFSNNFTGQIAVDFTRLPAFQSLVISSNYLEGDISFISSMTNCTMLTFLYLTDNLLSGSLPNSIANLSNQLSYLSIGENRLHGNIPSAITKLLGLTLLTLEHNDLVGPIPSTIGELNKLQEINLGRNKLTNEIPFSIGNLTLLNHLRLAPNNFYGNIPESLSNCSGLLTLDISCNNLNGSIPRGIMSLSSISISFNLSYNDLTGSIPSEVGALRNLAEMDLSHNRLSGLIPNSLSSCISMELLHLESNSLNGEIPDMLSALKGMQNLDLSQNNLSGHIPRFLQELDLVYLNLSINRLQGEVPTKGVFQNESAISLEGNSDLCGGVAFLNLPPCPPKKKHFPLPYALHFQHATTYSYTGKRTLRKDNLRCPHSSPKYGMSGKVSAEGDVYSYGILLLEMFTGRSPTDDAFNDHSTTLVEIVTSALPSQVMEIVDPIIHENKNEDCLVSIIEIGLACSKKLPKDRMSMTDVVKELGIHSTSVKKMGGGHGHDEPYYLHAKHMYNLDRMKIPKTMKKLSFIILWLFFYYATTPATCSNNETDLRALLAFKRAIDFDPQGALNSWNETVHFCNWKGVLCSQRHQSRVVSINMINHLSGTIPPFLGNFTSLVLLSLANCFFHGEIPESLVRLQKLELLSLDENNFIGRIPPGLYNISTISIFSMRSNQLQGTIPSEIGQMTIDFRRLSSLEYFIISSNYLQGDISFISSMANCTSLQSLSLFNNQFSGSLPDSIGNLSSHLSFLAVGGNRLHGSIPSSIGDLLGLNRLQIQNNDLEEIYLAANRLTNVIPISFGNLSLLNHLHVGQNNFYGNIPQSLSNCSRLLTLDISHYETISISFNLAYNDLTGSIPSEVGFLRNLAELDLSHNRLSGLIPNSLSSCISLELLHLESNSLNGEIPDMLSALRGLQNLDLSHNNLSGKIPRFLGELDLVYLNLSFNRLQGEVPTLGVFQNETAISLEGNNDLCGGVAYLKFPPCPPTNSKKKHFSTLWKILIPVVGAGAIFITLSACFYVFKYRQRKSQNLSSMPSFESKFLRLSYADLLKATDGFSEANFLGAGSFGSVYKGILNDGQTMVAVKVLNLNTKGASRSFISECNALRGIRHRNLVKLVSACSSADFQGNDFKALVYEFVACGSLDEWLHKKSEGESKYGMSGNVSAEGDVYSYGILLLEMFTGRRPTDDAFNDHSTTLVDIVTSALPSQVMEIVDPIILHENKNKDCVISILEIGLACSKELPKDRMSMTDVVKELCKTNLFK
ncbi:hypothetical protein ACJIZ3_019109 [Penstemon smallii]|uniref:Protein kinase domain-containing protein n=1 Tax=Penstemon smallii TaxID=265156 RepID=A0ABD3T0B7_9LAMI